LQTKQYTNGAMWISFSFLNGTQFVYDLNVLLKVFSVVMVNSLSSSKTNIFIQNISDQKTCGYVL